MKKMVMENINCFIKSNEWFGNYKSSGRKCIFFENLCSNVTYFLSQPTKLTTSQSLTIIEFNENCYRYKKNHYIINIIIRNFFKFYPMHNIFL